MITILVGKSASGKDAIQKVLTQSGYTPMVSTTTRPMREGETEGVDYHFVDDKTFKQMAAEDEFLEYRSYNVINNEIWYYGTPKTELETDKNYVKIVDLKGAETLVNHYGRENCFVVWVFADDITRQHRAESRGSFNYEEWNRRLKDDAVKFSAGRLGSLANYIAFNGEHSELSDVIHYLWSAKTAYERIAEADRAGSHYVCSLIQDEEGYIHGFTTADSDFQAEFSKKVKRLTEKDMD